MFPGNAFHFLMLFFRLSKGQKSRKSRFKRVYLILKRIRIAFLLGISALTVGIPGYVVIEDYSWFDAYYMATLVNKPDLVEFFTLLSNMGPNNVVFEEIEVARLLPDVQDKPIAGSGLDQMARISVVAVRRPNGQYELNPPNDTVLQPGWHIVLLGNLEQMNLFKQKALAQHP